MKRASSVILALLCSAVICGAEINLSRQENKSASVPAGAIIRLDGTTDKLHAVYNCGEPATFTFQITVDGQPLHQGKLELTLTHDGGKLMAKKHSIYQLIEICV